MQAANDAPNAISSPAVSTVCENLPPPRKFRKDAAPRNVNSEEQMLIKAYQKQHRREAIEVELSCSPSLPLSPSANDWHRIFDNRTISLQKEK